MTTYRFRRCDCCKIGQPNACFAVCFEGCCVRTFDPSIDLFFPREAGVGVAVPRPMFELFDDDDVSGVAHMGPPGPEPFEKLAVQQDVMFFERLRKENERIDRWLDGNRVEVTL